MGGNGTVYNFESVPGSVSIIVQEQKGVGKERRDKDSFRTQINRGGRGPVINRLMNFMDVYRFIMVPRSIMQRRGGATDRLAVAILGLGFVVIVPGLMEGDRPGRRRPVLLGHLLPGMTVRPFVSFVVGERRSSQ